MPAIQVDTNNGAEVPEDQADEEALTVSDHLEMALATAAETGMSTSELMGIFFYYAHSIAESYRQEVLGQES